MTLPQFFLMYRYEHFSVCSLTLIYFAVAYTFPYFFSSSSSFFFASVRMQLSIVLSYNSLRIWTCFVLRPWMFRIPNFIVPFRSVRRNLNPSEFRCTFLHLQHFSTWRAASPSTQPPTRRCRDSSIRITSFKALETCLGRPPLNV